MGGNRTLLWHNCPCFVTFRTPLAALRTAGRPIKTYIMIPRDFVKHWLRKERFGPGWAIERIPEGDGDTDTNMKLEISLCNPRATGTPVLLLWPGYFAGMQNELCKTINFTLRFPKCKL